MRSTIDIIKETRAAAPALASAGTEKKNAAMLAMADALIASTEAILTANALDIEASKDVYGPVMIDRLTLTPARIEGMAKGLREVAELPDPIGRKMARVERPNGLIIEKISVPMGVISIIYESRPNVTSDAAALALKAGSAVVLRGGKESYRSNRAIVDALQQGLESVDLPGALVSLVEDTTRQSSMDIMTAEGLIDLLIPRGGAGLIKSCMENAKVPCIETGTGICHIYVDESAELDKALDIIDNAKTSRPSVCNAEEVLLVNSAVAEEFLPALAKRLRDDRSAKGLVPVELRLDERAAKIIDGTPAGPGDFDTEFLNYILAVAIVDSADDAIAHIQKHSTHHSDAILTQDQEAADRFCALVDSAAVYVNASTRFTDGGEFGLGCEMGISTQKLHARGPMGLEELCTYK
ncbi:MAG: glutamate-5-semialdehyde dehydrogenase, partial [Firmicutes bacterium]|nr:glutamate-5-semialdehyde dehydrogenase [Bacillota bacterium]